MRYITIMLLWFCLTLSVWAGQTVVLVHGYLSNSHVWHETGIAQTLHFAGWQDHGHLTPWGITPFTSQQLTPSDNVLYSVQLPSEAPLLVQANNLNIYLNYIQQHHPNNELILIGHSVGGVVARLSLILNPLYTAHALISIATPHLGTDMAELGIMAYHSPLSWFTPLAGLDTFNRSQGLYQDLVREYPGSLLFWLNRQPHPRIHYVALIRDGDDVVSTWHQNLNNIPVLQGQARVILTPGNHFLRPADGVLLLTVLQQLQATKD